MTTLRQLGEQAGVLIPDGAVAVAGGCLQTRAVKDMDSGVTVADQPGGLERAQRDRDTGPPHPEHLRKKFVAKRQLIAGRAIMGREQPASQAFRYRVPPIAGRR